MSSEPLTPREVETLLRPDIRTVAADLFELSDNLDRMHLALTSLEHALADLDAVRRRVRTALGDAEVERAQPPARAD